MFRVNPRSLLFVFALSLTLAACSSSRAASTKHHGTSSDIVDIAESYLGYPYRYGGNSPDKGFDCSGLVFYVHSRAGYTVPRTAQAQYRYADRVSRKHLKPGDLVFFRINRNKISHVGIYLGKNRFIHAPSSGKQVSIASLDNPYWKKRFVSGGRIH